MPKYQRQLSRNAFVPGPVIEARFFGCQTGGCSGFPPRGLLMEAKEWAGSKASKGLTSGHVDPGGIVSTSLLAIGNRFRHSVSNWFQARAS